MGTKDKQTPSRCWERCSSPRRMCVRLPATPALPASTPGATSPLLIPHRQGFHRHTGAMAPRQLPPSLEVPGGLPGVPSPLAILVGPTMGSGSCTKTAHARWNPAPAAG